MTYQFSTEYNSVLGALSSKLMKRSPQLLHDYLIRAAVDNGRREVEIWFQTAGCRYFMRGGCTMCNYGHHRKIAADAMIANVEHALLEAQIKPEDTLLITPSGSMFDDVEVPREAYVGIMRLVAQSPTARFTCETQAQYATEERLEEYRRLVPDRPLHISCAIESANPWIRRNCLNKDLPTDVYLNALATARKNSVAFSTNILLGIPFLMEQESIDDTVATINWTLRQGVAECYVFPVHVKIGTLTHWLWERNEFNPPSLWSLVEVLSRLDEGQLARVSVAWHKAYYVNSADSNRKRRRMPFTCTTCYPRVVAGLDEYVATRSRQAVDDLLRIHCSCRDEWLRQLDTSVSGTLSDRVGGHLRRMGQDILAESWKEAHSTDLDDMIKQRPTDLLPGDDESSTQRQACLDAESGIRRGGAMWNRPKSS